MKLSILSLLAAMAFLDAAPIGGCGHRERPERPVPPSLQENVPDPVWETVDDSVNAQTDNGISEPDADGIRK